MLFKLYFIFALLTLQIKVCVSFYLHVLLFLSIFCCLCIVCLSFYERTMYSGEIPLENKVLSFYKNQFWIKMSYDSDNIPEAFIAFLATLVTFCTIYH